MRYYITISLLSLIFIFSCARENCQCPACPIINEISSNELNVGNTINITGQNLEKFGQNKEDKIMIGGKELTNIKIISASELSADIPQEIRGVTGVLVICSTNPGGRYNNSLCSNDICLPYKPIIINVSP